MAKGRGSAQLSLALDPASTPDDGCAHPDGGRSVCSRRAARRQATTRCRQCRRPLDVPSWIRDAGVRLHYCDARCRQAWVEAEPDLGVRVQPATAGSRRGANWDLQARRARERDQFACRVCGVTEEEIGQRLHVHHRIPFRRFRSNVEANKLEHLISVCPSCHRQQETELRRQLPLFSTSS